MKNYIPPYQITDEILMHVSSISDKIGQITQRNGLEAKPHLRKNNKIRSIHSSLHIEANSLSLNEVKDVINGKLVLGAVAEIQEVKNAYAAYDEISVVNPYQIEELKRIHGVMTKYLVEESGQFRRHEEGVFDGEKCIFMAPPAQFVPELMKELFDWMNANKDTVHPLIMSAVFHYEFVFIHPFSDGNGRMARLWHTIILAKWKPIFEYIPIESQIEKFQEEYYQAIAECHKDGSSTRFITFMLKQINSILDEIIVQSMSQESGITEYVKTLLAAMEYDIPYSAKELLQILNLKSKENLRKNYLNPALENGWIEMTLPDKPKSKNQRYLKK